MTATEAKTEANFYIVKVRTNFERKISDRIKMEMERLNKEVKIIVPSELIYSVKKKKIKKDGKTIEISEKVSREKILYSGYVFVETSSLGDLTRILRDTSNAGNLMKDKSGKYEKLSQAEIEKLVIADEEVKNPVDQDIYIIGESVKILSGVFETWVGKIDFVDIANNKIKVMVPMFGKMQAVDLTLEDITKI